MTSGGFGSIAELDAAVARGALALDRYWELRRALEAQETAYLDEHRYDLPTSVTTSGLLAPGMVPPRPGPVPAPPPPRSPAPPVLPPPGRAPYQSAPVRLPITGPTADAAETRADGRRRRWWRRAR